jgi:hypothetical protein
MDREAGFSAVPAAQTAALWIAERPIRRGLAQPGFMPLANYFSPTSPSRRSELPMSLVLV